MWTNHYKAHDLCYDLSLEYDHKSLCIPFAGSILEYKRMCHQYCGLLFQFCKMRVKQAGGGGG